MTKVTIISGEGKLLNKISKTVGEYTNYTYEVEISGKANKAGIVNKTSIRLSTYKDMGCENGDEVSFEGELRPYTKKDGSGTSYLFNLNKISSLSNTSAKTEFEDLDDEIPF